ncbi:MAG: DUF2236 domain-containing protein [Actinobacteria bacterium]|nr:MAG: DUF2236 domain-containing protein [Actinomycetota bacterium]
MTAPDAGLFGPGSVTWRVNREQAMLLGGGCALLLQLAHPLVAAGVADHSDFRGDPLKRLRRTLDATLAIVFGTTADADRAAAGVRAVHARVTGALRSGTGRFPAGAMYRAEDPSLLAWVNATLFDTSIRTYELLFGRLSQAEMERYYAESTTVARMLGVPDAGVPPTLGAWRSWWDGMLAGDDLAIGADARDLARAVLAPKVRFVPGPVFAPLSLFTIGLLPAVRVPLGSGAPARVRCRGEGVRPGGEEVAGVDPAVPASPRRGAACRALPSRLRRQLLHVESGPASNAKPDSHNAASASGPSGPRSATRFTAEGPYPESAIVVRLNVWTDAAGYVEAAGAYASPEYRMRAASLPRVFFVRAIGSSASRS